MSLKMFVWQVHPTFLGVAQANSVAEARHALLCSDLGESGDGSCPERDAARQFILEHTPTIWYGVNAEFVLSDSAQLREQEQYSRILEARVAALEADLAAAREEIARLAEDSERISVLPRKRRVPLDSCPVGLFLFRDTLAVMTEYATVASGNVRQRDAYIVASGEYFWGGASDPRERAKLLVLPCRAAIDASRAGGTR